MLKFEPEAMRAFVKYKPLKKLIAKCVHMEINEDEKISQESPKSPVTDTNMENDAAAMTR